MDVRKIRAMNKAQLEMNIIEACDKLIKEFAKVIKKDLGLNEFPKNKTPYILMEPSGSGRHSGRECVLEEVDVSGIWYKIEDTITASKIWGEADSAIKTFIDTWDIKPLSFLNDVTHSFLLPLFKLYFNETEHITYKQKLAKKVIGLLIKHLNAPGCNFIGLVILNNFKADKPFKLENDITIRPINAKDIKLLVDRVPIGSHHDHDRWIFSDCWVCEIKKMNPRGTFLGQNRISEIASDDLLLALRMFKQGDIGIRLGVCKSLPDFEGSGITRGTITERISLGGQSYYLSVNEIKELIKFWKKLQGLINNKDHYLQVPLRRMRHSGTRREKADSIIDYVIGLESLLGTKSEQTEIIYRFKVRGSVLLAKKRIERPGYIKKLAELYKLRSNIAHGTHIPDEKLGEYLPFAEESLRYIWKWYFTHYYYDTNNEAGINKIDCDLAVK